MLEKVQGFAFGVGKIFTTGLLMLLQLVSIVFTILSVIFAVKQLSVLGDTDSMGSGRPTITAKKNTVMCTLFSVLNIAVLILRIVWGHTNAINYILLVVSIVAITACYLLGSTIKTKDSSSKSKHRQRQIDTAKDKTELAQARAEYKSNKAIADGGAKVVKAKMDTAVATEQAKTVAVKSASAHMALGAIGKPKEALDYAQASGAISEGKEIADKIADRAMGDLAPTVVDGEYKDVTDEAKAVMSDRDAALAEQVKGMSRDALEQIIIKGAESLELNIGDGDIVKLSNDIYRYSPAELKQTVPNELTDEQKAAFLVERMTSDEAV